MIRQSDYENYDYRQFWQDDKRLYEDSAERLVIKKFISSIKNKDAKFIDLGCGFGRLFSEYSGFSTVIMVDYSVNNLKNAKELISRYVKNDSELINKVVFIAADVTNLPLKPGIIDYAMTVRVIHHIDKPDRYFAEVARILKSGGTFMLEFANKRNTKNILKFFVGKTRISPFSKEPLQVGATILDYHPKFIKSLLKNAGFEVKKMVSASNFRVGFLKRHVSLKILLFFESIYQNIFSFISTGPSIFLKAVISLSNKSVQSASVKSGKPQDDGIDTNYQLKNSNDKKDSNIINASRAITAINPADLFICPSCKSEGLEMSGTDSIKCTRCSRQYPVVGGIFNFKD